GLRGRQPPAIRGYDYRQVSWLTKRSAISLLPSVQSFVGLRDIAKASQAPKAFAGFGDFVPFSEKTVEKADFSLSEECRTNPEQLAAHRKQLLSLGPLPITATEVNEIGKTFPPQSVSIVLGDRFTDYAVKNMPLSDYRILYFATHGLLPSELACQPQPALVTSLPKAAGGKNDGLLDLEEIMGLKLDTDLIVLSACNTGGPGFESGGESLSGLARAFFFAGARALIVSHWFVEDTSTANLMVNTFKEMQQNTGMGWADALRTAQLKLMDDANNPRRRIWSHPFIWAAFTVVGDGAKTVSKI
ncbi:MAG: CHAT domain-containing protein, partial [Gammaproteobacteria bacterium]